MRRLIVDILLAIAWAYWVVVVMVCLAIGWPLAIIYGLACVVDRRR